MLVIWREARRTDCQFALLPWLEGQQRWLSSLESRPAAAYRCRPPWPAPQCTNTLSPCSPPVPQALLHLLSNITGRHNVNRTKKGCNTLKRLRAVKSELTLFVVCRRLVHVFQMFLDLLLQDPLSDTSAMECLDQILHFLNVGHPPPATKHLCQK